VASYEKLTNIIFFIDIYQRRRTYESIKYVAYISSTVICLTEPFSTLRSEIININPNKNEEPD